MVEIAFFMLRLELDSYIALSELATDAKCLIAHQIQLVKIE